MQQSSDIQHGLDYMIQLRDKLCKTSVEAAAMNKAIERYQSEMAMVELRNNLVYKAPRGFNNMFIQELEAEQKIRKENNKLYRWWQYAMCTAFGLFVLYLIGDILTWSPK